MPNLDLHGQRRPLSPYAYCLVLISFQFPVTIWVVAHMLEPLGLLLPHLTPFQTSLGTYIQALSLYQCPEHSRNTGL